MISTFYHARNTCTARYYIAAFEGIPTIEYTMLDVLQGHLLKLHNQYLTGKVLDVMDHTVIPR